MQRTVSCPVILALLFFLSLGCEQGTPPSISSKPDNSGDPQDFILSETLQPDAGIKEQLESLGYTAASQPAPPLQNVTRYDPNQTWDGLNLYASWHAPEAILMDMRGHVLHTWHYAIENVWPSASSIQEIDHPDFWRRVHPLPGGELLCIYEGFGLIRIDRNSQLLWAYPGKCHHDLSVTFDGSIFVLTREAKRIPRIHPTEWVVEDFIVTLDGDGREKTKLSILECFENSEFASMLDILPKHQGDIFHTNTLKVLNGNQMDRSPLFKKGNFLISILHTDTIAIIDPQQKKVVWMQTGPWDAQHEPTLLPNGNMLILDNLGNRGKSRIMEFNPFSMQVFWEYLGEEKKPFYTMGCGSCCRLPNGNTLITETDFGRAFEVTPQKETVWEFINPYRSGKNGELIAKIAEMIRLDSSYPIDWLKKE